MGQDQAYPTTVKLGLPSIPISHFETYLLINGFFLRWTTSAPPFCPQKEGTCHCTKKSLCTRWWCSFSLLAGITFWLFRKSLTLEFYFQPCWLTQSASMVPEWRDASSSVSPLLHHCPKESGSSRLNSAPYCKQQRWWSFLRLKKK